MSKVSIALIFANCPKPSAHRKDTRCVVGPSWSSSSSSSRRGRRAKEEGEGRQAEERKRENENRAWPINHTFVGITLLYTLAFARSKGSPRCSLLTHGDSYSGRLSLFLSLSPPLSSLSPLPLAPSPSFSLSHASQALPSDT